MTNTISLVAVPIFFTTSGFLFFQKVPDGVKLKKQISRILILYLIWSVIYLPYTILSYIKSGNSLMKCCIDYLQNTLFSGTSYQLWFLPSLTFALAIVYFLSKHLKTKGRLIVSILLYLFGCLTATYTFWFTELQILMDAYRAVFITTRNGLFFGVIFVYAGKCIADNEERLREHFNELICTILIILSVAAVGLILESYFLIGVQEKTIINMNLMSVPLAIGIVSLAVLMGDKIRVERAVLFRRMSTIIFCVHPWIIYTMTFVFAHISISLSSYMKAAVVVIVTTVISYVLVKLRDRVDSLRYLM